MAGRAALVSNTIFVIQVSCMIPFRAQHTCYIPSDYIPAQTLLQRSFALQWLYRLRHPRRERADISSHLYYTGVSV